MAFQLVSLLCCLLASTVWGQYPVMPGFGGHIGGPWGFNGGYNQNQHQNRQQHVDPSLLTCINADAQDIQSQVRLTLRPLNSQNGHFGGMGIGFGQAGMFFNRDAQQEWTVDGVFLPSQVVQKTGSYQVGVFEGGRTFGECKMAALGQLINSDKMMGGGMGYGGPFSPMAMNPFMSMFGGMYGNQQPNGIVSNTAVVSTGTTMYSGLIRGVSYNQLIGRSIGVCQTLQGGQCYGLIPYCCSITSDTIPASEVFVDAITNTQMGGGGFGFGNNGFLGGQGGSLGLAGGGLANGGVNGGSLQISNDNVNVVAGNGIF